jgi:hypothetical protein
MSRLSLEEIQDLSTGRLRRKCSKSTALDACGSEIV